MMRDRLLSKKIGIFLIVLLAMLVGAGNAEGATRTASVTGNWNSTTTWGGAAVPTVADDVRINSGVTVTLNVAATCNSLTFVATANSASNLNLNGYSLNVSGAVTLVNPAGTSGDQTITVGTGTLSCASIAMANTDSGNEDLTIRITTGTVNVSGNITMAGATTENAIRFTSSGALNVGGNFTGSGAFAGSTSTVTYSGSSPIIFGATYYNLVYTGSGTTGTPSNNLAIQGNLTNTGGGILNFSTRSVTLSGTVSANIAGFTTTGTVFCKKTSGTATFTGNVNGGALSKSGAGTLDLGSGLTHTFTGNWGRTAGTINGGSSLLRIGGSVSGTGGTFTAGTGTVEWYRSGTQTCAVVVYNNLILSGTSTKTFATTPTVNGVLSMEGTTASVVVTSGAVTYGSNATLQYNKTAAYTATTEEWPATFSGTGGVKILNSGIITFGAAKVITNNILIASGSSVNLGTITTHSAGSLTLAGSGTASGSWGSTSSSATHTNNTFFAATSGILNVTSNACIAPTAPTVGLITQPTCGTATATVALSGLPSSAWTVTANPGGATISGSTATANFSGLAANTNYTFTVTLSSSGCTSAASGTAVVNAQPITPSAPTVGLITQPTCGTATATIALSGLPTLAWTVTASPGGATLNGSTASANFSGLAANNTYTFTVTLSSTGCTSLASGSAVVNAQPITPAAPTVGIITQPTCATATGTVALSGLPASAWIVTATPGGSTISGSTTTANFSGLAANNTYTFTVTLSSTGCTSLASGSAVVNAQPITPAAPTITPDGPTTICAGGSVTLTSSAGSSYLWSTGATTPSINVTIAGSYTVQITNAAGCQSAVSTATVVMVNATPTIDLTETNETCPASNDGKIATSLSGGLSNIQYIKLTQKFVSPEGYQQVEEIQAFEALTGNNVALSPGAVASSSSTYQNNVSGFGPQKVNDGITTGYNFWHSFTPNVGEWVLVDLGSAKNIDYLRIFNREDCCYFRGQNMLLELFDAGNNLVYSKTVDLWEGVDGAHFIEENVIDISWNDAGNTLDRTSLDAGTYILDYIDAVGCSVNSSATIGTTNSESIAPTSISGTTTICNGESTTLSVSGGSLGTGASWKWYSASCGGTLIGTGSLITLSPSANATYYVRAEGICNTTSCAQVTVTVNPNLPVSVSIVASANPVCAGTSVTFTATPTNGGATPVYQWQVNGTNAGSDSPTFSYTPANADVITCILTSNATCVSGNPATSNTVTMAVSAEPTIANAGPDQTDATTCGLTSVSLAANTPTVGTGAWSVVSGVGGSFGDTASPVSSFSGNPGSTYTLRWTISNGACPSSSDETVVTFNTIPTITGTTPSERCGAGSVTLGATASAGTINWYDNPTGGLSQGTGTSFATPVISVSTIYFVDATSNGCTTGSRTAVTATVYDLPSITVSPDATICSGSNTTLTASGGSSYVWSPSTGLSSTSGVSVTASPTATTTYTVTGIDSNGCNNTASTTVTVNELPTFSSLTAICAPDLLSYNVSVTVSSGNLTSTEGIVNNTGGNDWTISSIPTGTNTTLTVTDINSCLNSSVVTAPDCSCPTINAPVSGGNQQYCTGSPVSEISASVAVEETVDWYSASSGGTFLNTGLTYTPLSAGIYYAEARNTTSNCKSSTRTAVTITENPNASIILTSASGTDVQTVCINSPMDNITYLVGGGGTNAGVIGLPSGLSGNFNAGVYTISGSPTASGTFNYTVTTTGTCSQASANGTVTVDPASVGGTISGGASAICLGESTGILTLSGYTGTILGWDRQINSGGWNSIGNGGNSTFSETPYPSGTWEYRATLQNGVCAPEYSSIFSIDVNPTTVAGWISGSSYDPVCEGASTPTLTLNGSTGNILRWEKQLNSGAWQNIANTSVTFSEVPSSGGAWGYRALVQSGTCTSAYQTPFTVVVNPTLTITMGSDPVVCQTATSASLSYSATSGSPAGWVLDFDGSAISAGFGSPQNGPISGSSGTISINIPYSAAVGVYYATLKVITYYPVCSSINYPVSITVNPNLPVGVSIAADLNPVCSGTNVTFTATPTNGGSTPVYQWKKNGGNVGSNSATYTDATLANGDLITCELTSNASCITGNPATSNAVSMTVNPSFPVSVSIGASANPVCAGTSVTFTATPSNEGSAPTYQWKKNGNNVGSNSATYTDATLDNGDLITCVLTSNVSCATGNPATSNTVSMTVNPNLPVSVSIGASANPVCAGTSVTFSATSINGGATPSYQWKVDGNNAGSNSSIFNYTPLSGEAIICELISNASCATGNPATSNTVSMTVNPNLPVSVSIGASANPICEGTSVTFSAMPSNGGATPSYQWKVDGNNAGSNSSTFTYTPSSGEAITCELTSNATCATGNPATSNTVIMTVNPNLPVSVSIGASANPVCAGTSVTFSATSINGGATPSYQWKVDGNNAGLNSSTFTYTPSSGEEITCELTSNATCATGNPATSNTVIMTVNPNLPVSVSIGASANPICAGTSVTFIATPSNGGATPSYQWKVDGNNAGSNSSTFTYTPSSGEAITCELTSNATCATGNPAISNTVTMTVNSISVAPTNITGVTSICEGGSTELTLSGGAAGTGGTAEWFTGSCGGTSAGSGNSITISPASSTTYYVRYAGTCNTTICASVLVTVNLIPTVGAGGAVAAICQGSTSEPLGGLFGGGATSAVWSDGGAGGSFTNNDGSTPGTTTYTASLTASSTVTLTLTTIGGSCGTASDSKQITVDPVPTPSGFTTD